MNILIISQYFWPENFKINELAEYINKKHNVTVLTGWPNYPEGKFDKNFLQFKQKYKSYNGVEIIRVKVFPKKKNKFFLILNYFSFAFNSIISGYWKIKKKKFDLIFVYQPSPITVALPGLFYKFIYKAKLVTWILDIWPETLSAVNAFRNIFLLKIVLFILRYFVKFYYRFNNIIFTTSVSAKKIVSKNVIKKNIIDTLFSWETFSNTSSINYDNFINFDMSIFNTNKLKITFAGNIGEAQDFESFIKSVEILNKQLPNRINWIILGDGSKSRWLKNTIKTKNISNVFILGRFNSKYMTWFYDRSDLLMINLKKSELFQHVIPAKIQSYLASKKPIVGMISGEVYDLINKQKAGIIVKSGNYNEFTKVIIKFLNMTDDEIKIYRNNAFKIYTSKFDKVKILDELILKIENV